MQPTAEQDLIEARELLKKQLLVENAGWPWIAAEIAEMATAVGVLQLPPQTTQHPASAPAALRRLAAEGTDSAAWLNLEY